MNSAVLSRLRSEALELSEPERALSLDGPPDSHAAQEWDTELVRRMDEVEAGTATLVDRSEFQHRMRERLANPKLAVDEDSDSQFVRRWAWLLEKLEHIDLDDSSQWQELIGSTVADLRKSLGV